VRKRTQVRTLNRSSGTRESHRAGQADRQGCTIGSAAHVKPEHTAGGPSVLALSDIPPSYLTLYMDAAQTCPGLPWNVLAGIGEVESDHGQSTAPGVRSGANYAGAEGPMQFEPTTFAQFAVNAHPAARLTLYNPADAIYTAAAMLCASGAASGTPAGIRQAIFAYNHSPAYIRQVLSWAARYAVPTPSAPAAAAITFALRQLGKPYQFSGGPGGEITLNPRVCPAQKADISNLAVQRVWCKQLLMLSSGVLRRR
jgi:Transglycosylase SLT domain